MPQRPAVAQSGSRPIPENGYRAEDGQAATLVELLQLRAAETGSGCEYGFLKEDGTLATWTVADIERRAMAIAAVLQVACQPGDRVLLVYPPGIEFVPAFLGCMCAGVLPVPATYPKPRRPMPRLTSISQDSGAAVVLTTSATLDTLELSRTSPELQALDWLATDAIADEQASRWKPFSPDPSDLAFLQYTSGSTSDPKGVMVTHANLMHNLAVITRAFDVDRLHEDGAERTSVWWLPAYHDMGLIGGILGALYAGGRLVMMSPATFLKRPMLWLKAMSDFKATVSGAPNFAYDMCVAKTTLEDRKELDLSRWRLAFCGAEPVRAETLRRFAEAFAPCGFRETSFYPCYGLAEATLLATGGDGPAAPVVRSVCADSLGCHQIQEVAGRHDASTREFVGCGRPWLGQEVLIVDSDSRLPVSGDRVGEIWLRGPSIARGYWNRREETAAEFEATRSDDPTCRYLRTGDLGFFRGDQLFVTGRVKEVIIVRGRNLYPQDIEMTVGRCHAALDGGAGAAFSIEVDGTEQLVVVHEIDRQYRGEFEEIIRAVRQSVVHEHELDPHAVVLIRQVSLPRTTSGKIQRNLCRRQYLAAELNVVSHWTNTVRQLAQAVETDNSPESAQPPPPPKRKSFPFQKPDRALTAFETDRLTEQLESWLLQWLVERAGVAPAEVDRSRPFAEYGLDSLTAVELSQELEDGLRVKLAPIVAWNYPTPATLARYLAELAGGESAKPDDNAAAVPAQDDDEFARLLAEIEALSDEEARSQLRGDNTDAS
jgi:acyl-CoA synthetase (AMP-forming)/AMP-acid ligase II/acyl carrier protein